MPAALSDGLRRSALEERHRWPLWLPVALGAGMALYFAAPVEPPPWAGWAALALFAALAAAGLRDHGIWMRAGLGIAAALSLGFAVAKLQEMRVAAPVLAKPMITHLTGRVAGLDWGSKGLRVILDQVRSGRLPDPPARARILIQKGGEQLRVGQGVGLTAQLMPPPGPATPGDNDFGRAAFFAGIGATGFSFGAAQPTPLAHPPGPWGRLTTWVEDLRARMTQRIRAQLPKSEGAIATAIITGERGGIDPEDEAALRDAGLAHVLAIAGLHMALVGAGLFWLVRAVLAAIPALALNYPIKKWAAAVSILAAGFYIVISGASASATRAFVMLAMMLLAILLDRPALSMRSLGLAAVILLLLRPVSITEPGFQMSFAAVASLVAVAEWEQRRVRLVPRGWLYRHIRGIAMTSLVASLATLPFAMFYFGRATHYAVLGNLLAMPLMGLVTMPSAALSVAAMPFGLEHAPLQLMGWSIDGMLRLGRFVSGLPGAVTVTPAFPLVALVSITLGGLWILLWRLNWRWWGFVPVAAGIVLALMAPRPDMLIASDARTMALRGPDGLLHFPHSPKDRFAATRWLLRDGDGRDWKDAVGGMSLSCDGLGCVAKQDGLLIALSSRPEALDTDCDQADIVVSAAPLTSCPKPRLALGAQQIADGGGYAIAFSPLRAASVNQQRGMRPWVMAQPIQ
ncbi:MAG: ComEC/Rec2 family competence protein [Alphaproteobacteria bacterium]|nr:ComEC/Rec2 family competence protein [Alphaproteobacteria bacterium]